MLEILASESGPPTARLDGRFLHSPRDPVREAERATGPIAKREPPCVVMLGFGLGYTAEALLATTQSTQLIVFEPDSVLTEKLRSARDVSEIVSSSRLAWCDSVASLEKALAVGAGGGFEVLSLNARRLADPDSYAAADSTLAAFESRVEINANTVARFGRLWVGNLCRNVDAFAAGIPVTALSGLFGGMPGLLLAAGPTLEQILPRLPELASRTVVVAVDTAVSVCEAYGVEPDIAVVVDPQYWNARHLDRVGATGTLLVAESSTHPSVFRRFRPPTIFCSSQFPLGREIESAFGSMGSLGTGGSVSTTAWDLLRYAGCSAVYTAGLDLGFPSGRTHFRDSFFELLAIGLAHRLSPAEKTLHRYIWSASPRPVAANDGTRVLTDRRMELYRNWFARQIAETGAPPTFTLTAGGAQIEGVGLIETSVPLSGKRLRSEIVERTRSIRPPSQLTADSRRAAVLDKLRALSDELHHLKEIAGRASAVVSGIAADLADGQPADFSPLTSIDREIGSRGGRAVVSFLMQQAIGRIRAGYGSASMDEQVDASRQLYQELGTSVDFHLDSLDQVLGESDPVNHSS